MGLEWGVAPLPCELALENVVVLGLAHSEGPAGFDGEGQLILRGLDLAELAELP